jgi:putative transposase
MSLQRAIDQYLNHYRHERLHQGKGNAILFPAAADPPPPTGPVLCNRRLGGLLTFYHRVAA